MKRIFTSTIILLFASIIFMLPCNSNAQSLEMSPGGGPSGSGPSQSSQVVTFQKNTNNPIGNTFATYTPTQTVTYSFSDLQYPTTGLYFGATISTGSTSPVAELLYSPISGTDNAASSNFTSTKANTAGTGIDASNNYAIELYTSTRPLYVASSSTTGTYYYGKLTLTFSNPVNNPVLNISSLGGGNSLVVISQQYSTDLVLSDPYTMQALSGNGNLAVDNTTKKIYNGSSSFGSSIADNASGSVLINGYNISSLTFSVYMRGKGSFLSSWGSTLGSVNYGDAYSIGVSLEVPFSISGNLFDDANGMTDGIVNGTGANAGGMNAILVDHNTGMVADYKAIPASGAYSFDNVTYGDYDVMISTASPTINATAPTVALPSGWVNTGEYTQTTAGSDGTPDGKIALGTVSAATTNINFGIDELPVSVAQVFTIPSPVVDASAILNGSGTVPQPLQGSDQDDHTTRATTPSTVAITELPSNGQLWYNGVMITKGKDGINAPSPTNPFIITSYNPNRLSIKFTGSGYVTSSFKYSIVDNAGMLSTPSLYTVNWTKPLAIQMTQFSATEQNCTAKINFATGVETDVKEINIQYSTDGSEFATVQTIAPKGSNSNYSFQYSLPANSSDYHFYQLEIVDIDGKKE